MTKKSKTTIENNSTMLPKGLSIRNTNFTGRRRLLRSTSLSCGARTSRFCCARCQRNKTIPAMCPCRAKDEHPILNSCRNDYAPNRRFINGTSNLVDVAVVIREPHERVVRFSNRDDVTNETTPVWNVTDGSIRAVPRYYPIQKTSIRVTDMPARILAERISSFLRINSIAAKYDDVNASIEATSRKHVVFNIILWRGKNVAASPEKGDIILEAHRLSGDSVEFQKICNGIFETVSLGDIPRIHDRQPEQQHSVTQSFQEEMSQHQTPVNTVDRLTQSDDIVNTVSVTISLLNSKRLDSNRLGMESLCLLTSSATVRLRNAAYVSHLLLFGDDTFGLKLHDAMLPYILKTKQEKSYGDMDSDDDDMDWYEIEHESVMRNLALQSWANSLKMASMQVWLPEGIPKNLLFWLKLLPVLISDVNDAANRPHDASLSAKCLCYIIYHSKEAWDRALELGIVPAVKMAHEFGKERYLSLEIETSNLLSVLTPNQSMGYVTE